MLAVGGSYRSVADAGSDSAIFVQPWPILTHDQRRNRSWYRCSVNDCTSCGAENYTQCPRRDAKREMSCQMWLWRDCSIAHLRETRKCGKNRRFAWTESGQTAEPHAFSPRLLAAFETSLARERLWNTRCLGIIDTNEIKCPREIAVVVVVVWSQ